VAWVARGRTGRRSQGKVLGAGPGLGAVIALVRSVRSALLRGRLLLGARPYAMGAGRQVVEAGRISVQPLAAVRRPSGDGFWGGFAAKGLGRHTV